MISHDQHAPISQTRDMMEAAEQILSEALKFTTGVVYDQSFDSIAIEHGDQGFLIAPWWFEMHAETGENVGIMTYRPEPDGGGSDGNYTAMYGATWNFDTPAELAGLIAGHVIERMAQKKA
jgi:hypothetical protein